VNGIDLCYHPDTPQPRVASRRERVSSEAHQFPQIETAAYRLGVGMTSRQTRAMSRPAADYWCHGDLSTGIQGTANLFAREYLRQCPGGHHTAGLPLRNWRRGNFRFVIRRSKLQVPFMVRAARS
jgi:hypothetical protein